MTDAKQNAALLMRKINAICDIEIQSKAVDDSIKSVELACSLTTNETNSDMRNNKIMRHLAKESFYAVACHPVSCHFYSFGLAKQSLENKICLKIK